MRTAELLPDFANEELKGKRVTFIPTASIPEEVTFYVGAGKEALTELGVIIDELEITKATSEEISDALQNNDYIYISGGNTFFLLQELKKKGVDRIIIEQINAGKLYIGESSGSILLSPNIEYVKEVDDYCKAPELKDYSGFSLVDFYPLPHYTNYPFKKVVEKIIAQYESKLKLIPISNSQVIGVKGNEVKIKSK
jgi:dipeptidase E